MLTAQRVMRTKRILLQRAMRIAQRDMDDPVVDLALTPVLRRRRIEVVTLSTSEAEIEARSAIITLQSAEATVLVREAVVLDSGPAVEAEVEMIDVVVAVEAQARNAIVIGLVVETEVRRDTLQIAEARAPNDPTDPETIRTIVDDVFCRRSVTPLAMLVGSEAPATTEDLDETVTTAVAEEEALLQKRKRIPAILLAVSVVAGVQVMSVEEVAARPDEEQMMIAVIGDQIHVIVTPTVEIFAQKRVAATVSERNHTMVANTV